MRDRPGSCSDEAARLPGGLADYAALARFDHSIKHVMIIPGIVFAYVLRGVHVDSLALSMAAGLGAAICIGSANYVINEWLDRHHDRFHPSKSRRAAVQKALSRKYVFTEWLLFLAVGFACALAAGPTMLAIAVVFALQGAIYNIPPLRAKDRPYLDVISESINTPLRLMIGWAMVDPGALPPSSILLAFWTGGAFLMSAKRMSEYREIVGTSGRELLVRYRKSFDGYSEASLAVSCLAYALTSSFCLAVFLIKYRIEYLLIAPTIIVLFAYYFGLSMQRGSSAQNPEKLMKERGLLLLVAILVASFLALTFIDVPALEWLASQRYISLQ